MFGAGFMLEAIALFCASLISVSLAYYKPQWFWGDLRVMGLRQLLGDRGTLLLYYILGTMMAALSVWTMAQS